MSRALAGKRAAFGGTHDELVAGQDVYTRGRLVVGAWLFALGSPLLLLWASA